MEKDGKEFLGGEPPSSFDLTVLKSQFGRKPRDVVGVFKRCFRGRPQAILTRPFFAGKIPFPSLVWLTCPFLVSKISELEAKGLIDEFERRISQDEQLREKFLKAQDEFIRMKEKFLAGKEHNLKEEVVKKGIAGVSDLTKIKCLHAHYAHYLLTRNNPIGEIIYEMVGEGRECPRDCWEES